MDHPFQVGQNYRNREGEYQVIQLDDESMTIRYSSGESLGKEIRSDIAMQQRIWENLEIEQEIEESDSQRAKTAPTRKRKRSTRRKASFAGFTESDFGSLGGSSWRGKQALGGLLADYLRDQTGIPFQSWGVRRRLEVHIARPDKYDFGSPLPCAKLFVYTHEDLNFGYYIETPEDDPMNGSPEKYEHWNSFRDKLENRAAMQSVLLEPMLNHGLRMTDLYNSDPDSSEFGGALQCEFQFREGSLQWHRNGTPNWESVEPQVMFDRISKLPEERWVDLHIFKTIPQDEAIAQGSSIIQPILETLRSLVPLYQMTVEK